MKKAISLVIISLIVCLSACADDFERNNPGDALGTNPPSSSEESSQKSINSSIEKSSSEVISKAEDLSTKDEASSAKSISSQTPAKSSIAENSSTAPEVVIKPKANISGGEFTRALTIKLTSETENVSIFYRLDGQNPTLDDAFYKDSLVLTSSVTLTAIAYKNGTISEVLSEVYTINICPVGNTFTDTQNDSTYRTVQYGTQCWMAENLNYRDLGSNAVCYGDHEVNCENYGPLYPWNEANSVCPDGWKLPSDDDWETMAEFLANEHELYAKNGDDWTSLGTILKSATVWGLSYAGTNLSKFNAFPVGFKEGIEYHYQDGYAGWWTSTKINTDIIVRYVNKGNGLNRSQVSSTGQLFRSVRCIKEN